MSLIGTYVDFLSGVTLNVTTANDDNGNAEGTVQWGSYTVPVSLHYHFGGPESQPTLWVAGANDDPNQYVGGAGYVVDGGYQSMQLGITLCLFGQVATTTTRLERK